jgi:HK97 family phage portal protein
MFLAQDIAASGRGPTDDFWYLPVRYGAGGTRPSVAAALAVPAMYACALVLGQDIGKLPCQLFRKDGRSRAAATDHPLYRLIHRRPNRWQTAFQWRQMMQWHLMLRYNAYSRIYYDRRGRVEELVPLHPDRVTVERGMGADGVVTFRYRYRPESGSEIILVRGEMFHVRGLSSDGIEGFSPLDYQGGSVSEALAAQNYSRRNMENDARPGGVLEWEGHFKSDEERAAFRASWHAAQGGANVGKTAVLERGMQFKEIKVSNADLQLVDQRKLKGYDIAAINRMPPHKIGLMERATFSNIEHQSIEYATDTMQPWCTNWEQELSAQLLTEKEQEDEQLYFEFNMNALLRGDAKARGELYGKLFSVGAMSPNDIRERENENPIDDGDRYYVPVNMVPSDRVDDVVDKGGNKSAAPGSGGEDKSNARARALEQAAAARVVRKEAAALRKIAPGDGYLKRVEEFYRDHISFVEDVMQVDAATAMAYCAMRADTIAAAADGRMDQDTFWREFDARGPAELLACIGDEQGAIARDPGELIAGGLRELAAAVAGRPASVVNVAPAKVKVEPAVVNVTVPERSVTVQVPTVKVDNHVDVPPAQVVVQQPAETVEKIERDADKEIVSITRTVRH